jgi:glycosyltransferase involved in cell wall biosynthesis
VPAVSVVVPTYNCAGRLVRALESVAAQSWPHRHLELIVVDDGSSDDTADRVRAFAARTDIATRYVFQQNAGPAAARNHGLRLARGTAVAFLDADDRWCPEKLERQVPLLHGRVGLVYCANRYVDADDRPLDDYVRDVALHRGDIVLALFCDFFLLTSAVVLSREALDLAGCFDENLPVGEDYEFFLRVACSHHADYVADALLVRCVRPDSLSRRDYALDARIDLATLQGFVDAHPAFARRHREPIR